MRSRQSPCWLLSGTVSFHSFDFIYFTSNESFMRMPISSQVNKRHAWFLMLNRSWLTLFLIHFRMTFQLQASPRLAEMILVKDLDTKEHALQCQYPWSSSFLKATKIRFPLWHPIFQRDFSRNHPFIMSL